MSIDEMDTPQFSLSQVAQATGWHLGTLRDYMKKGVFPWDDRDAPAKVAGSKSMVPLRSVLRLGITYQLWNLGVSPKDAFMASVSFCDLGSADRWRHLGLRRTAGECFAAPWKTLLLWRRGSPGEVVPAPHGPKLDIDALLIDPFEAGNASIAVVDVSQVWADIVAALKADI